ncbi:hypothetical protein LTR04_000617 [Oleoguttula sp. CCFEE 6159]|nr:hypothetical protein LTR04_000617 [Oleoguttula sp. CCFEE 6159]
MRTTEAHRNVHVLFASTSLSDSSVVTKLLPRLAAQPNVSLQAILDNRNRNTLDLIKAAEACPIYPNVGLDHARGSRQTNGVPQVEEEASELCGWADLLVLAPLDADNLAKMLSGMTDNLLLQILRSWDVSKKILIVPGMSDMMWENPMTKKQLSTIRRKWNWIRVLQPVLWYSEDGQRIFTTWDGLDELVDAVRNQVDLMTIGQDVDIKMNHQSSFTDSSQQTARILPPELWSIILTYTADWELAKSLDVYTILPVPQEWRRHASPDGPQTYMEKLEWTILTGTLCDVKMFFKEYSTPRWLSRLCTKLIMRFAMTPLLAFLEADHKELFWQTFGHTFLPDKASSVFGRVELLEYWRTSPSFLTKEYTTEAIDGASRAGFIHVLTWWHKSGLPLRYTEAALEQASSQNHIAVLDWWKAASATPPDSDTSQTSALRLKPGKSICYATQAGHLETISWWLTSGIPFSHESHVARLASTHGHIPILSLWHALKSDKMIFDNQVLVGATKMGHADVLEWWKNSGLRVEYKTCDVEEALEDGLEGRRGEEVRRWWARNGLNLGIGTSEWMKTKFLN